MSRIKIVIEVESDKIAATELLVNAQESLDLDNSIDFGELEPTIIECVEV